MPPVTEFQSYIQAMKAIDAQSNIGPLYKETSNGVHEQSAILKVLQANSKRPWTDGGAFYQFNINTQKRRTQTFYGATPVVKTNPYVPKRCFALRWHHMGTIAYHVTDLRENKGTKLKSYMVEQLNTEVENMGYTITMDILGDGTTSGDGTSLDTSVPQLVGFGRMIETTPGSSGNSYVGHTRTSTTSWLNNQSLSITSLPALTANNVKTMISRCTHANMSPDFAFMSDNAYDKLWGIALAQGIARTELRSSEEAYNLGLSEYIKFNGVTFVPDKHMTGTTSGGLLTSGDIKRIYFVNSKEGVDWVIDTDADMKVSPVIDISFDQRSLIRHIDVDGTLASRNPKLNGVIYWS